MTGTNEDNTRAVGSEAKALLALHVLLAVYSLSSVCAKLASGFEFMSFGFIGCYAGMIALLGVYAIGWQQIIKRCDLSVAYANRSMAILWSLVWTVIFFHESLTVKNIIGVLIVFAGTMIVNSDGE